MDWKTVTEKIQEFYNLQYQLHLQMLQFWRSNILFTWRWWLVAAMAVVPWVLWIFVRKKDSTDRLLHAGLFIMVVSTVLDSIGVTLQLWTYPTTLAPMMPEALSFNISVLPVVTMLFIQFFPKVKPIWKALVYGAAGGFLFEQLMEWAGIYCDQHWEHYYTFLLLAVLYLLANRMATRKRFEPMV